MSWVDKDLNDPLRAYFVLEYFTKDTVFDEEFYLNKDFIKLWVKYVNINRDGINLISMQRKEFAYLYEYLSVLYEIEHDFLSANQIFLSAMKVSGVDLDEIKEKYEAFLNRILKRINREIEQTVIEYQIIEKHIRNEMFNNTEPIYTKGKKRLLNKKTAIYLNFTMSKKGIEINEEGFDIIERGNECVELYRILIEFLYKNDEIFKRTEDEHKLKHRKNEEKKPFSWFDSSRRIIKEKVDNRINQFKSNFIQIEKEKEHNELLTNDSYLMTPDKTIKESKYNEITIRKPLASAIYGSSFIKGKD